ncbi:uncharacterized protein AMSG_08605 [Thecamonas trahens ATCC 50062]|uniref:COX assembly mitochondrial protein n=1 Tax=Thecamonas trahens ATCC 50062 TaxID=461836 RepID=A0A0L0DKI3_THETB|nr:hypothetical protein AMSG_08605 [Thecamonas trahens ATCC 50062]KNC52725.1 hypothetical protein AMSG_08605 [Thecamonas trahens ATCC 50062]|eukprot:XP_013755039.1 hypothetical protein AMSG_08605 [Thecamonas trahens ATCC 50062]
MPREGPPDAAAKPSPFTTTSLEHVLEVDPSTIEVTRKAEEGIVYKMRQDARSECHELIGAFAECAKGRMVSFLWACQTQKKAMNRCLKEFINEAELAKRKQAFVEDQLDKYRAVLAQRQSDGQSAGEAGPSS